MNHMEQIVSQAPINEIVRLEPILTDETNRYVILPIDNKYKPLWDLYKKHIACFWTAEEIDYSADKEDWESLSDNERYFIDVFHSLKYSKWSNCLNKILQIINFYISMNSDHIMEC